MIHRRSGENTAKVFSCPKTPLDPHDLEVNCQSQPTFQNPHFRTPALADVWCLSIVWKTCTATGGTPGLPLTFFCFSWQHLPLLELVYTSFTDFGFITPIHEQRGAFLSDFCKLFFCTYIIQGPGYVPPRFSCQVCQCSYVAVTQICLKHKTHVWKWRG